MKVIVKKRGNSAVVRIPAAIMAAAHLELNQPVDVRPEQGRIVIEPIGRKSYKLDELIGGIAGGNLHKCIDTGAISGKDGW